MAILHEQAVVFFRFVTPAEENKAEENKAEENVTEENSTEEKAAQ